MFTRMTTAQSISYSDPQLNDSRNEDVAKKVELLIAQYKKGGFVSPTTPISSAQTVKGSIKATSARHEGENRGTAIVIAGMSLLAWLAVNQYKHQQDQEQQTAVWATKKSDSSCHRDDQSDGGPLVSSTHVNGHHAQLYQYRSFRSSGASRSFALGQHQWVRRPAGVPIMSSISNRFGAIIHKLLR